MSRFVRGIAVRLYDGQRGGSGRNGPHRLRRPRGVSPIIATILVVAIVVVLAAVLYVVVASLTHPRAGVPLGSQLALGPAAAMTGSSSTPAWCATGHGCYAVSVADASSSLGLGEVAFAVEQSANGPVHTVTAGTGQYDIVNAAGVVVAYSASIAAGQPLTVTSWTYETGYSPSTAWSSQLTLCIEFGTGIPNPSGHGFVLTADGLDGVQGTVAYSLP
jgi:flagellin-like protein